MGKLIFTYGVMGSAKTANAIIQNYELNKNGKNVLLLKPATDTRDGIETISSRIGISALAKVVGKDDSIISLFREQQKRIEFIIVDEAQFLTSRQVEELKALSIKKDVSVYCYGLKSDFQTKLFEGSKRLIELASELKIIEKDCSFCGMPAEVNARFSPDGKIVTEGEQIMLGANDVYKATCYKCYDKLVEENEQQF